MSTNIENELKKTEIYFSRFPQDSLKLEAFMFLSDNISDKISFHGNQLDRFYSFLDSLSLTANSRLDFESAVGQFKKNNNNSLVGKLNLRRDINAISSNFLIENIQKPFYVFERDRFQNIVDFGTFCEYVLPYKLGNEIDENFRTLLLSKYNLDSNQSDKFAGRGLPFHKQRGRVYFIRSEVIEYIKTKKIGPYKFSRWFSEIGK
ncbi:MAG: hypothetical protein QM768_19560 [Agriterribacter sp.]